MSVCAHLIPAVTLDFPLPKPLAALVSRGAAAAASLGLDTSWLEGWRRASLVLLDAGMAMRLSRECLLHPSACLARLPCWVVGRRSLPAAMQRARHSTLCFPSSSCTATDQRNMFGLFESFAEMDGGRVADWTLRFSGAPASRQAGRHRPPASLTPPGRKALATCVLAASSRRAPCRRVGREEPRQGI